MSVNTMSYEQVAALLNNITNQVTGRTNTAAIAPADFISVATTALSSGYDPVLSAITQMVSNTIFSIRPYTRKLADLQVDSRQFGAITRKLKITDQDWEDTPRFDLVDGESVDPWKVNKANVLQLNFYGANVFDLDGYSVYKEQLDNAFTGPDELGRFLSMLTQNSSDMIEQKIESVTRMLLVNFIGGKIAADNGVIHLLTEYNAETGLELTAATVYSPENFPDFVYWLYARLETLAGLMAERSELFQINITGKIINQHTQGRDLKVKMYAPLMNAINARVRAKTFDNSYLQMAETEAINYWQSIRTPNAINVKPSYLDASGSIVTEETGVSINNVVGTMFDRDALGVTTINRWSMSTPMNPKGGYANIFHHFTERWWTDYTEKGVILCMD